MRKKEDLGFLLDTKISLFKFDEKTQELIKIKDCLANVHEEDSLDKRAFQSKVLFNIGYRFKTNGQSLITITMYDLIMENLVMDDCVLENEVAKAKYSLEDVDFVIFSKNGKESQYKRISNIRNKTLYLKEFVCLEEMQTLEISNQLMNQSRTELDARSVDKSSEGNDD